MGEYAVFIWTSYGLALTGFFAFILREALRHMRLSRRLDARKNQDEDAHEF